MEIKFSIWLATKTRWAHLTKLINLPTVPLVGEFEKFNNGVVGDYVGWQVSEIIYRESGQIEVQSELLDDQNSRGYSFEEESEFDEYFYSYIKEGWACDRGIGKNTRYLNKTQKNNSQA